MDGRMNGWISKFEIVFVVSQMYGRLDGRMDV